MPVASIAIIEDNDKTRNYLFRLIDVAFEETGITAGKLQVGSPKKTGLI